MYFSDLRTVNAAIYLFPHPPRFPMQYYILYVTSSSANQNLQLLRMQCFISGIVSYNKYAISPKRRRLVGETYVKQRSFRHDILYIIYIILQLQQKFNQTLDIIRRRALNRTEQLILGRRPLCHLIY